MKLTRSTSFVALALLGFAGVATISAFRSPPGTSSGSEPAEGGGSVGVPISHLPFRITRCGRYYVTRCLKGAAASDGIAILADDVSLDLGGFTLTGAAGSGHGIAVRGENVSVHNGTVREWGGDGINVDADRIEIEGVNALDNAGLGIWSGSTGLPRHAIRIVDNQCVANGGSGICVANWSGGLIEANYCAQNGSEGIDVQNGDGLVILDNTLIGNFQHGIELDGPVSSAFVGKNQAAGNVVTDFSIGNFGQVVSITGGGTSVLDHKPWANISIQ